MNDSIVYFVGILVFVLLCLTLGPAWGCVIGFGFLWALGIIIGFPTAITQNQMARNPVVIKPFATCTKNFSRCKCKECRSWRQQVIENKGGFYNSGHCDPTNRDKMLAEYIELENELTRFETGVQDTEMKAFE